MTHFKTLKSACITLGLTTLATSVQAHEDNPSYSHATDHAPIGVMADHRHKKGDFMLSYRYMHMDMAGSRDGTNTLTPETIATTIANPFFGLTGQPPTLRVVPRNMTMDMHMVGGMYGFSDRLTLMAMTSYVTKDMSHTTFQGGMGTNILGTFKTKTDGLGDSTVGLIYGLDDGSKRNYELNANLALSLPTGSNKETGEILTPMGGTPTPRLPYPMQLGHKTYDLKPGLTYRDRKGQIGWGGQAAARIPLGKNKEGYKYGNRLELTAWVAYEVQPWISTSLRLKNITQGDIIGQDASIIAPVQTADTQNHGGDITELYLGMNIAGQTGLLKGHRLAFEYGLPLRRNLNGPQLETDKTLTIGWQKAF